MCNLTSTLTSLAVPLGQTVTLGPGQVICDQTVGPDRLLAFALSILGLMVCLIILWVNSAAEVGLTGLTRQRLQALHDRQDRRVNLAEELLNRSAQTASALSLVNVICLMAATALAISSIHQFNLYGPEVSLMVIVLIFLVLCLVRVVPKGYALAHPDRVILRFSGFVNVETLIMRPVISVVHFLGNAVLGLFRLPPVQPNTVVSQEEISMMANIGEEEGMIQSDERQMIRSIFQFGDTLVREVMVPRLDIQAISGTASLEESLDMINSSGKSRLPVYTDDIDHIVGVLYAKDLLRYMRQPTTEVGFQLARMLRPAYYVPESKKVDQLFAELQKSRVHIAIIVDEYGGTAGLVTIEDLLEEIVGEIQDEYDTETPDWERVGPDEVLIDARLSLSDVNNFFRTEWTSEEIETIGGFVYDKLGRIPLEGDQFLLDRTGRRLRRGPEGQVELDPTEHSNQAEETEPIGDYYRLSVVKVSGQRLQQLRLDHVTVKPPAAAETEVAPERVRRSRSDKASEVEPPASRSKHQPLSE